MIPGICRLLVIAGLLSTCLVTTAFPNERSSHDMSDSRREVGSTVPMNQPWSATVIGNRYALLVGIDHYSPSYGPSSLNTCTNDATGMRDIVLLGDPSNRWTSSNIRMLTDAQATKSAIQSNLYELASASGAGDMVVYAHSSHGGQSAGTNPSNTYLCAYNTSYTDAELGSDLTRFQTNTTVIVIVDACYSGGLFKDSDTVPEWPFAERVMTAYCEAKAAQLKSLGESVPKDLGQNIAFMTACDYDEYSYTSSFYSLYMGYLVYGCAVSSVDTNSDWEYEFLELHDYAAEKATERQSTQHAQAYHSTLLQSTIARAVTNVVDGDDGDGDVIIVVTSTNSVPNDFDGDGKSDPAVYQEASGYWSITLSCSGSLFSEKLGESGYVPVSGDYDGDFRADLAVYNETTGWWYWICSSNWSLSSSQLGESGYTAVPGDYDGDGRTDLAVYNDTTGWWYFILSSTGSQSYNKLGEAGYTPMPGNYDGDGKTDLAVYHEASGYWYVIYSSTGSLASSKFGAPGYTPVSGDYDGDGKTDLTVYHEASGYWFILYTSTWSLGYSKFGEPGYSPVSGDYDGDGITDLAVYHQSSGYWYIVYSSTWSLAYEELGGPGYSAVQ